MSAHPTPQTGVRELTIRGVIIGGLITLLFTAANVYLGLKVGLTFATSIPAAVISMAILRYFRDHTVIENNIVQTIASAAGTLSAIIFVLPGLVMIGWWAGFPYWQTVLVTALGGILGVMYSIPLRRALVTGSDLPFPEGVAAAEVLKVGDSSEGAEENRRGLLVIIGGALAAAGFSLLSALKLAAGSLERAFRTGAGGSVVSASLSMALIGVGHLVGITVGIAMIVGLLISFAVLLPIRTAGRLPDGEITSAVWKIFSTDVRFVGAGAMAVAAVWTLAKIAVPIARGIKEAVVSTRARRQGQVPVAERDLSMRIVGGVILVSMVPIGLLLWRFLRSTAISHNTTAMIIASIVFVLLIGLAVAGVCGYMAGLIGASNSPISGVGILIVITAAGLIKLVHGAQNPGEGDALIAYTLFTAAVVFGVATISNDNLQDLKTGQLVNATPWKQQVALVIGVVFGSLVIPPVLQLLNTSFGFAGAPNATENALAAPQAALLSSLAKGVFGGDLNWGLLGLGALIGAGVVAVDEVLGRVTHNRMHLPPLAVGMGMYLPMSLTLVIPLGALAGLAYDRSAAKTENPERSRRLGTLAATGLIVGESLFGVAFAGVVAATGQDSPLAVVGPGFASWGELIGVLLFAGLVLGLYLWVRRISARTIPS